MWRQVVRVDAGTVQAGEGTCPPTKKPPVAVAAGGFFSSAGGGHPPRAMESRNSWLVRTFFIRERRNSMASAGGMSERKLRSR